MVLHHQIAQVIVKDMRIDLGCCDIRMTKQRLDHTQIGPAGQKMCREGMAQGVGRDLGGADPGQNGDLLDQDVEVMPRDMARRTRPGNRNFDAGLPALRSSSSRRSRR